MSDGPLAGFTVGVTAARRREELRTLLERRGARVISAPAIAIVPLEDDARLVEATRACLRGVDIAVATTGTGFRGWLRGAERAGLDESLLRVLGGATLLARGPKARGAIREAGLPDPWEPGPDAPASSAAAPPESLAAVWEHLLTRDIAGARIAVQLHGEPLPEFTASLTERGAEVVEVPVYRWRLPDDTAPLHRMVELVAARRMDAVTFTSAPAVTALLDVAGEDAPLLVEAFRDDVLPACVGPVCAEPLERAGVRPMVPRRARLSGLVRELADRLPGHRSRVVQAAGHRLEIRGQVVLVDSEVRTLTPVQMAVLRTLAETPGRVVSRAALQAALPRGGQGHAVEVAIGRLRSRLGDRAIVRTVTKRGYRLATS